MYYTITRGPTEKFRGWSRYSYGMWLNELIFQHCYTCCPHIRIAVLESHWSKKSTADMTSSYEVFSPPSYILIQNLYEAVCI